MKKFFSKVLFTLMCIFMAIAFMGCGNGSDDSSSSGEALTLTLNKTELTMLLGEETQLTASYTAQEGQTLTFSSDAPSVVTVDETGKITAIKEGSATVTASYGKQTATCSVEVSLGGMVPTLDFAMTEREFNLAKRNTLDLSAEVLFNGKSYDDATFTYALSDDEVAEVVNNVFTPKKAGEVTVTVSASWRGIEDIATLSETFTITVVSEVQILVNDVMPADFVLYTIDSFEGNTYTSSCAFVPQILVDGDEVNVTATPLDSGIVSVADGTLSALSHGETQIQLSFVVDGETKTYDVNVRVIRPVADYAKTLWFSASDNGVNDLKASDITGDSDALFTSAYDADGNELTINATTNAIEGIAANTDNTIKETYITVYIGEAAKYGYKVNLKVVAKAIREANDLLVLYPTTTTPLVNGYYVLVNDIVDASGLDYSKIGAYSITTGNIPLADVTFGFAGIFDGQGYTISKYTTPDPKTYFGLTGRMLNGAAVRNVAFENVLMTTQGCIISGGAPSVTGVKCTIENVYVSVSKESTATTQRGLVYLGSHARWTLKNVLVVNPCTLSTSATNYRGVLFGYDMNIKAATAETASPTGTEHWSNVYVISGSSLISSKNHTVYASNEGVTETPTEKKWVYKNTYRYADEATMIAANNDYSSFTATGYWHVDATTGMLCWGAATTAE